MVTFKLDKYDNPPTYKFFSIPTPPATFNDPEYISLDSVVVVTEMELSLALIIIGCDVLFPAAILIDVAFSPNIYPDPAKFVKELLLFA